MRKTLTLIALAIGLAATAHASEAATAAVTRALPSVRWRSSSGTRTR